MFPNLKQAGKKPVLNAGTELGPGRGCSRMLGTGNFPVFFGKIRFPGNGIRERRPLKIPVEATLKCVYLKAFYKMIMSEYHHGVLKI